MSKLSRALRLQIGLNEREVTGRALAARIGSVLPGFLLTGAIACISAGLRLIPVLEFLSPMVLAVLLGLAGRKLVDVVPLFAPGIRFSVRPLLRIGIVLLGLQISIGEIAGIGLSGLAVALVSLTATLLLTLRLGRLFRVDRRLACLIAAGTSICGASAVLAASAATRSSDEDTSYAIGIVTLFGTFLMLLYPLLFRFLGFDERSYGLWSGASIHEVAQVTAATLQVGPLAGDVGMIVKLGRVAMLAPAIIWLARICQSLHGEPSVPASGLKGVGIPAFIIGFVLMIIAGSLVEISASFKAESMKVTVHLFTMALAGVGLEADIKGLKRKGLRPLALGAASTIFIAVTSLALVELSATWF